MFFEEQQTATVGVKEKVKKEINREAFDAQWKFIERNKNEHEVENAKYEISLMGREALPMIIDRIRKGSDIETEEGLLLVAGMAEEEDRLLVMDLLGDKMVAIDRNASSWEHLLHTFNRLNLDLRLDESGEFSEVEKIMKLESAFVSLEDFYRRSPKNRTNILPSMAVTGCERAKSFLATELSSSSGKGELDEYVENVKRIPVHWVARYKIKEPLQRYNPDLQQSTETDWGDIRERANSAFDLVEEINPETTAREALWLYAYNEFAGKQLTEEERKALIERLKRYSKKEERYRQSPLPTTGLELEIPYVFINKSQQNIISRLNIRNHKENRELFEVNPTFSYAASTQSRLLHGLTELGAVPLHSRVVNGEEMLVIPDNVMLSLHLNFGIPQEISRNIESHFSDEIHNLVEGLVYAYVSPRRIRMRKTQDISWGVEGEDVDKNPKTGTSRLEIKIVEFSGHMSYRMVEEAQDMAGAMFAYFKRRWGRDLSVTDEMLADQWEIYEYEVNRIRDKYQFLPATYNKNVSMAEKLATNEGLRKEMRENIQERARQVRLIVFGKEQAEEMIEESRQVQ